MTAMTNPDLARQRLRDLLGASFDVSLSIKSRTPHNTGLGNTTCERLELVTDQGTPIRAFLTGPPGTWEGRPAVLYCHAHGGRYEMGADEIFLGRPSLQSPPYGQALAHAGIVALCIDMLCFGERQHLKENATGKACLWRGQTLFGMMLAELAAATRLLQTIPGVSPERIGIMGFSMGATHAFWLAALEPEIRAAVHIGSLADLATLTTTGAHDKHGIYMMVPGLARAFRTGEIAGLIAPRPQLACMGLQDTMTPPDAVDVALADIRFAYAAADARDNFTTIIDAAVGHVETPEMRAAAIDFLRARL